MCVVLACVYVTMGSGSSTRSESPKVTVNESPSHHHHNNSDHQHHTAIKQKQQHVRQASIRHAKQPMPDPGELERRFTKVLVSFFIILSTWVLCYGGGHQVSECIAWAIVVKGHRCNRRRRACHARWFCAVDIYWFIIHPVFKSLDHNRFNIDDALC